MASIFGTPNEQNYLMTYTSENSNASIIYDKSLNGFTFKLFNEMFMPMASGESSWLNIRQDEAFKDSEGNPVTTASFDILMENVSEAKTGYIVLYSGNTPMAAICCKPIRAAEPILSRPKSLLTAPTATWSSLQTTTIRRWPP